MGNLLINDNSLISQRQFDHALCSLPVIDVSTYLRCHKLQCGFDTLTLPEVHYALISVCVAWLELSGNNRHHDVEIWIAFTWAYRPVSVISVFPITYDWTCFFGRHHHRGTWYESVQQAMNPEAYGARSESRFTHFSLCFFPWCPKGRCARDALPRTFNIDMFKCGKTISLQ